MAGFERLRRQGRAQQADGEERAEYEHGLPSGTGGQQYGHGDDRTEFAPCSVRDDRVADGGSLEAAFLEDRHERAERGGGERDDCGDAVDALFGEERDERHDQPCKAQRDHPCDEADLALMPGKTLRIDLIAGEQEQECHAELAQEFHSVVHLHHAKTVWTERGSGGEQQHGLRNEFSWDQLRHDRADGRHRHDDGQ